MWRAVALPAAVAGWALCGPAAADDLLSARERTWFATAASAVYADSDLLSIPEEIVTGNLDFRDAYLVSLGVSRVLVPDFAIPVPFSEHRLVGNSLEIEAQVAGHFGKEDMTEATLALTIRSGEIPLWDEASVNIAFSNGLSYALEDPSFEVGVDGVRGEETERLQYYIGLESEWTFTPGARWHFLTKLHHRSGVYGLISPQETGSNYMGAGLRFDIE